MGDLNSVSLEFSTGGVMPRRATVITDASFCHHTRAAGWAAWVTISGGGLEVERIKRSGRFHKLPGSSTVAERWALFNGIWLAAKFGATTVLAQTDCKAIVDLGYSNPGYLTSAEKHWPGVPVSFRHVKGHTVKKESRYYVNRWCDEQAGIIMREQRRGIKKRRRSDNTGDRQSV